MFHISEEQAVASIRSLEEAMRPQKKGIVRGDSFQAIRESTLDFRIDRRTVGTGLKVTTDGYFFIPNHQIGNFVPEVRRASARRKQPVTLDRYAVRDRGGSEYLIDPTVLVQDKEKNVAILKALIPGDPRPIGYNSELKPFTGQNVRLIGSEDQDNYRGKVVSINYQLQSPSLSLEADLLLTDIVRPPSGTYRMLTSRTGKFMGISTATTETGTIVGIKSADFYAVLGRYIERAKAISEFYRISERKPSTFN